MAPGSLMSDGSLKLSLALGLEGSNREDPRKSGHRGRACGLEGVGQVSVRVAGPSHGHACCDVYA